MNQFKETSGKFCEFLHCHIDTKESIGDPGIKDHSISSSLSQFVVKYETQYLNKQR